MENKTIKLNINDKLCIILDERNSLIQSQKNKFINQKIIDVLPCGSLWINGKFTIFIQYPNDKDNTEEKDSILENLVGELEKHNVPDISSIKNMFTEFFN